MDANQFDRLVRSCFAAGTRRGLLRLLAAVPLSGGVAALFDEEAGAAGRRKRRKKRHKHQQGDNKENRTGKRKGKQKDKDTCAQAGQTPKPGTPCCLGLAEDAGGRCAALATCTPRPCPLQSCGEVADGCGGTLTCGCAADQLCHDGTCQTCHVVCPSGSCPGVLAAVIAANPSQTTLYLCPGTYPGNVVIDRDLTLIGAGDGDGRGDTILRGTGNETALFIAGFRAVTLQRLRVSGGSSHNGGGIAHLGERLTMTACTVTRNTSDGQGGGIFNGGVSTLLMTDCAVVDNEVSGEGADGGGIANAGTLTLTRCTVAENSTSDAGGGIFNQVSATLTLVASVVTANRAGTGGGIFNSGGTVTLDVSTVDENFVDGVPNNCAPPGSVPGCNG